jgi:hypothetical protein
MYVSDPKLYSMLTIFFTVCKLVFLPTYSPDFNPIEHTFSAMKAYLRRNRSESCLYDMMMACNNVTPAKAAGWFRHSGYI